MLCIVLYIEVLFSNSIRFALPLPSPGAHSDVTASLSVPHCRDADLDVMTWLDGTVNKIVQNYLHMQYV